MKELVRILKNNSRIIIISNHKNRYCAPQRVKKRIQEISLQTAELIVHVENINAHDLYSGYEFLTVDGNKTIPTRKITIDVKKN